MYPHIRWITVGLSLFLPALPASAVTESEVSRGLSDVVSIDVVDVRPVPIKRSVPFYPPELRDAGVQGKVVVEFIVGLKGQVIDAQVVSTDDSRLNFPALATVKTWKYKPAKHRKQVVNCRATQLLEFNLD
jgi:TonB family protein